MSTSAPSPTINALRNALHQGADPAAAYAAMIAAAAAKGSKDKKPSAAELAAVDREGEDDGHEVEDEISYTPYRPANLKYGLDHPDPVVENATLAAVAPPNITYNLAMPSDIIHTGKLSNLQLEAVVYGCQRHMMDLPKIVVPLSHHHHYPNSGGAAIPVNNEKENAFKTILETMPASVKDENGSIRVKDENGTVMAILPAAVTPPLTATLATASTTEEGRKREPPAVRAGFLLGDGAGMGKGRTLAGFVVENIARGRKKHVWISVSSDLYEDAKRDLRDLGMGSYAENKCYNLGKLPYGSLISSSSKSSKTKGKKSKASKSKASKAKADTGCYDEGVMFATYSTLIGKNKKGTRLEQLVEWCGGDNPEEFDGLIMLDECHKAKTIDLDENGKATKIGKNGTCSQTAAKVVELQDLLPRARVVYCSATSVSEPKNLGFMSRLGLWGPGTEHPSGFNQFLKGLDRLGTGAMELHAMHLKSIGAIVARTLSYSMCEFDLIDNVGDAIVRKTYNESSELWTDLHSKLADRCRKLKAGEEMEKKIKALEDREVSLTDDLFFHRELNQDSDSESDDSDDDDECLDEQKKLRRLFRSRKAGVLKALFWSAHQRYFRSLCIASKVDKAIELAKKALEDGHSCVIGLQSTGEARAKGAAKSSGINLERSSATFEDFVSAPNEDLKRIIMQMFPLPPRPKGVIAPEFLNLLKKEDFAGDTTDDDTTTSSDQSSTARPSGLPSRRAAQKKVNYSEVHIDNDGNDMSSSNGGKKRKSLKVSQSSKKSRRSSVSTTPMTDSDEESDFTVTLSGDDADDDSIDGSVGDNANADANVLVKRTKASRKSNSIPWNEIPLDCTDMALSSSFDKVDDERLVLYRKSAEQVKKWLEIVESLNLPANPLDRLLNELGGPDKVAELTGRKTRQVEVYDAMLNKKVVVLEKRKGEGRLDQINIEEKNNFQSGSKKIAILSEAASTGISLQADKRVKNQCRRVHITLELPWSADKAIQQLGRTHRSNQSSGPIYKFLISDVGGEKRFASAVCKRLAKLGALTQGDRRATGSASGLGLGSFDLDNHYGKKALTNMFAMIWTCSTVCVIDSEIGDTADTLYIQVLKTIEEELAAALDGGDGDWEDNLRLPYESMTVAQETRSMMIYNLLTGCCKRLSQDRIHAIKEGRTVVSYMDALTNGIEDKDTVKANLNTELTRAKESGLNFNVLCNFWLYDVGIMQNDEKGFRSKLSDVSRFLNRLLGLNLSRQKFLFHYFMSSLENVVSTAKNAGTYDVGIKTLTGNNIEFDGNPRSFTFRGLEAKDERVLLYKVNQDTGITWQSALELFNNAKGQNVPTSRSEWNQRGQKFEIVTGFYMDSRSLFKLTPKVWLIINGGAQNDSCVTIRPNIGRRTESKQSIRQKLNQGSLASVRVDQAMKVWKKEFHLADIAERDYYQYSCPGRHTESYIFAGAIVPILDKFMKASGYHGGEKEKRLFRVVRVDTSAEADNDDNAAAQTGVSNDNEKSDDELEFSQPSSKHLSIVVEPLIGGEEDIGKGVARKMADKIGASIFRGQITKYKDDDEYEDCDPSGSFFVKFTDGSKLKMDADKANIARKLFEKEASRLAACGMPREDICNSLAENTVAGLLGQTKLRSPILGNGEDQDPENHELIFEEKFEGDMPDAVVGLMFSNQIVGAKDAMNNDVDVPRWEAVLMNLSKSLISAGVESSRQLYNLEKVEGLKTE